MNFKQELAGYWVQQTAILTEQQIKEKIDTTISNTFARLAWLLLISFWIAYAAWVWIITLPISAPLYRGSWIAWLWIIFWISMKRQSLQYNTIALLLVVFALLQWYGLSWVFMIYSLWSIYNVFLTTWIAFGVLAVIWWKTDIDITRVWPILMGALIWLIIAMVINMFWWNAQFDIWISIIWLVIFAWFVLYDMNLIKQQALFMDNRTPLLISLWLFINFVNIFLFLLRLIWNE